MYAIRSYYAAFVLQPQEIELLFHKGNQLTGLAIDDFVKLFPRIGFDLGGTFQIIDVITSYSIHYTKLYELFRIQIGDRSPG